MNFGKTANNALQLTSNTPLRSVLRSTELKRYMIDDFLELNKYQGDSRWLLLFGMTLRACA